MELPPPVCGHTAEGSEDNHRLAEKMIVIVGMDHDTRPGHLLPLAAPDARPVEAVRRAQDGDEPSFHAVVAELGPLVYRFLVVRLAHEQLVHVDRRTEGR